VEFMIHIANVLYMMSYLMRDILWLRVLTVFAASCIVPYFYFRPEPLMAPIYWNLLFTFMNIYAIWRLLLERRPVQLTADEQRLRQLVFRSLTPREMLKLVKLGRWEKHAPRECCVECEKTCEEVAVICSGKVCVELNGQVVTELREGQFIGGTGFFIDEPSSASVIAVEPTRCMWWPKSKLKTFLKNNPDIHAAFQMILGMDLTSRLQAALALQEAEKALSNISPSLIPKIRVLPSSG
jgi:CRP-like cAMP-binding protein